jgi:hypothetical protein
MNDNTVLEIAAAKDSGCTQYNNGFCAMRQDLALLKHCGNQLRIMHERLTHNTQEVYRGACLKFLIVEDKAKVPKGTQLVIIENRLLTFLENPPGDCYHDMICQEPCHLDAGQSGQPMLGSNRHHETHPQDNPRATTQRDQATR